MEGEKTKEFPKGVRYFHNDNEKRHWILGQLKIEVNKFIEWLRDTEHQEDQDGTGIVRIDIAQSQKGTYYCDKNNYKPKK